MLRSLSLLQASHHSGGLLHAAGSMRAFRLQKRIIRIMTGCRSRDSCRDLFIDLKILPQLSLYIYIYIYILSYFVRELNYTPQIMKYITIVLY